MLVDEFVQKFKKSEPFAPFFCSFAGFNSIFIQGKFEVEFFSSVKIVLSFKKEKLFVFGQNLGLKNLDGFQMALEGDIFCVSKKEVKID